MTDRTQTRFLSALLQQEQPLSSPAYEEYRAMLDQKLTIAERKERRGHRWMVGMWIAVLSLGIVGAIIAAVAPPNFRPMGLSFAMVGYGLFWLALLRAAMYVAFERPAVDRARADVRDAQLMELTRKVDAIIQRLETTPTAQ